MQVSIISGTDVAVCTAVIVAAMVDDSNRISWETEYNILRSWVGVLMFYVLVLGVVYLT
jgi:hypothetical protein